MMELIYPSTKTGVSQFYFLVCVAFLFINIIWDIRTDKTPKFHIGRLRGKINVIFSATTFASSILLMESIFNANLYVILGDVKISIIVASLSGFLISSEGLCPYPLKSD